MLRSRPFALSSLLGILSTFAFAASMGCAVTVSQPADTEDGEIDKTSVTSSPIMSPVGPATAYPEAALVNMGNAYCSGAVIAPRVALTAGHCVAGSSQWTVITPNARETNGQPQQRRATGAWTQYQSSGNNVNPNSPDVALIFFDSGEPFRLTQWPKIQMSKLANGTRAINVGRKNNGQLSTTNLYVGNQITLGAAYGYPYSYQSSVVIEAGDSGGPVFLPGGAPHTIVAVNSGAGGGTQVLARTDAVGAKITELVQQHGGFGGSGESPVEPPSGQEPPGDPGTDPGDGGGLSCNAQETEPNNQYTQPNKIPDGATCGKLADANDVDWFTWSLDASGVQYEIAVGGIEANIQMWKLVDGRYYKIANDAPNRIAKTSTGAGQYFVAVASPSNATGNYQVVLRKGNGGSEDPGSGGSGGSGSGSGSGTTPPPPPPPPSGGTSVDGHSCSVVQGGGGGKEAGGQIPVCCAPSSTETVQLDKVFAILNDHRRANGLGAVTRDMALEASEQGHCMHMAMHTFFDHSAPESSVSSPWTRAKLCGTQAGGENIAAGYRDAASVMQGWKTSSGHNANMLNPSFKRVGLGYYKGYWGMFLGY